jgi:hypothetical protein
LGIEDASTLGDWSLNSFSFEIDRELSLFWNDIYRGFFYYSSGSYNSVSDERLKTNIKPMGSMLEKINQPKPSVYQFKNTTDKQEYNGFITQDVLKIFRVCYAYCK